MGTPDPSLSASLEPLKAQLLEALEQQHLRHHESIERLLANHAQSLESTIFKRLDSSFSDGCAKVSSGQDECHKPLESISDNMQVSTAEAKSERFIAESANDQSVPGSAWIEADKSAAESAACSSVQYSEVGKEIDPDEEITAKRASEILLPALVMGHKPRPVHPLVAKLVTAPGFEFASVIFVLANTITIGMQQDWLAQNAGDLPAAFVVLDMLFLLVFTFELFARMAAAGPFFFCWANQDFNWNVFDTLLVSLTIMELPIVYFLGTSIDFSAARLIRLIRLVRLLRTFRLLRFFKQLRIIVWAVAASAKPLLWTLALLFCTIYLSAVLILQLVGPNVKSGRIRRLYGSLMRTQYTLFACVTNGIGWSDAADPLIEISPAFSLFFVVFIAFCSFCIINIVTGIFVENAKQITELDEEATLLEEAANREQWMQQVVRLFEMADTDGSGDIDLEEFEYRLQDLRIQVLLKNLGIDVMRLNPKGLFNTLDFNRSGTLTIDEFADGLMRFHGFARSLELAEVRHLVIKNRKEIQGLKQNVKLSESQQRRPSGNSLASEKRRQSLVSQKSQGYLPALTKGCEQLSRVNSPSPSAAACNDTRVDYTSPDAACNDTPILLPNQVPSENMPK